MLSDGSIEKRVRFAALCKVEWFDNGQSVIVVPVSSEFKHAVKGSTLYYIQLFHFAVIMLQIHGLAVAVKPKNGQQSASVTYVMNVTVDTLHRRGYTLTPGINDMCRHTTVLGESIADIPTRYTITGLETYELPVIGKLAHHAVYSNENTEITVSSTLTLMLQDGYLNFSTLFQHEYYLNRKNKLQNKLHFVANKTEII